ncbi:MAG: hypothetical protein LBU94_04015 [Clostridiales bacterium]|jgi:branched-subunit amino acid ABC-type transport system permease component|nr:hypothetical protein [Clostridiales bacterium]
MGKRVEKKLRRLLYGRLAGVVLLSISFGMFLVLILPGWVYFAIAACAIAGAYLLFFC